MLKSELIRKAELYLDDSSELSTQEMSELFDKVYAKVCSHRPWEFTKASHTATVSGASTALPSDFLYMVHNNWEGTKPVVYVGIHPYPLINWGERRAYDNRVACYIDYPNSTLNFCVTVGDTVSFDYHRQMPKLTNSQSPAFPEEFHPIIFHGMAVEELMIEQFEKARSYAPENELKYKQYLDDMAYWNSKLMQL